MLNVTPVSHDVKRLTVVHQMYVLFELLLLNTRSYIAATIQKV